LALLGLERFSPNLSLKPFKENLQRELFMEFSGLKVLHRDLAIIKSLGIDSFNLARKSHWKMRVMYVLCSEGNHHDHRGLNLHLKKTIVVRPMDWVGIL